MFVYQFPDATDDAKLQQIRNWRNDELAATDWTQLSDAPVDKVAWARYRQSLRDLPSQIDDFDNVQIPARP